VTKINLQHGKFVVVDLNVAGRAVYAQTFTSASSGSHRYGIIRFRSARGASDFITAAQPRVVVGRATSEEVARDFMQELLDLAAQNFRARNRFVELWIGRDGTVKYRQNIHQGPLGEFAQQWQTITSDDDSEFAVALRIAARRMLCELTVPFEH
jgi:hypothetical protein